MNYKTIRGIVPRGEDLVALTRIQQKLPDLVLTVLAGEHERGVAVHILGILVRTRRQQRLHGLGVAVLDGEHERGPAVLVRAHHDSITVGAVKAGHA